MEVGLGRRSQRSKRRLASEYFGKWTEEMQVETGPIKFCTRELSCALKNAQETQSIV